LAAGVPNGSQPRVGPGDRPRRSHLRWAGQVPAGLRRGNHPRGHHQPLGSLRPGAGPARRPAGHSRPAAHGCGAERDRARRAASTRRAARRRVVSRRPMTATGRHGRMVATLAALGAAAAVPAVLGRYWAFVAGTAIGFALYALSIVVITGFTGQISLAQTSIGGMGAF